MTNKRHHQERQQKEAAAMLLRRHKVTILKVTRKKSSHCEHQALYSAQGAQSHSGEQLPTNQ
jgi:hypothetical protein